MSRNFSKDVSIKPYWGPVGGWGSAKSVAEILLREAVPLKGSLTLWEQNKPHGFACVSCSYAKLDRPGPFEFCENGAKATAWETTSRRAGPAFFANHTLSELETWSDHDLEEQGRLTHPMRWDAGSDKYVPVAWSDAFDEIGRELRSLDPNQVDLYTSGRASLETSYMYQLFARMYGSNNLPDSSNMCHESSSVALPESIGSSVGTAILSDFENTDCIFYIAQNVGTSSPRMLHDLQDAVNRGVKVVTFNLLRERGLERFINPQSPQMLTGKETKISSEYYQVRNGGDIAALFGVCKALIEADDALKASGASRVAGQDGRPKDQDNAAMVAFAASMASADNKHVLDHDFIQEHTTGFEEFAQAARAHRWDELERVSGLSRAEMMQAARTYANASAVMMIYGMGLTQHLMGVENVHMVCNLALLRGNIGKPGANICAVRGHSNVQGQRTVGISEKPELVPLDKLAKQFGFEPPRKKGLNTVEACKGILAGKVKAFFGLGGNFVRAIPERAAMEEAWTRMDLTVQIATKLNHSHLVNGKAAYLLPCRGRTEQDMQASGPQVVSIEDTFSCIQGSIGLRTPASEHLKSETAIVAGIAKATLPPNPRVKWDEWVDDYGLIRNLIAETYPKEFHDFNARMFTPGGFYRGNAARERIWKTKSGKAEFTVPKTLSSTGFEDAPGRYRLLTMRSNDQFNTTIYGFSDRLRGIEGTRQVLLINPKEMERAGLSEGQMVSLVSDADDGVHREVGPLKVVPFKLPDGCIGSYYPEMNPLIALSHHDEQSKTPAAKSVPVRIRA